MPTENMLILLVELEKIQSIYGYIPENEIAKLSNRMKISKSRLYGIITFYSRFYTKPKGENIIRICKSVTCGMNGSEETLKSVKEYLDIEVGETTKDNMFTLELVECLGQCNISPALTINDEVYGELTSETAIDVIKGYQNGRGDKDE